MFFAPGVETGTGCRWRWGDGYSKSRFLGSHFLILHGSVLWVFSIHGSSVYETPNVPRYFLSGKVPFKKLCSNVAVGSEKAAFKIT